MTLRCDKCGSALPEFGGIIADDERGEIRFGGRVAYVAKTELELFTFLLQKKGRVATKASIMDFIYQLRPEQDEPDMKIVDVFVCKLRKKIAPLGVEIGTQWGGGYFVRAPGEEAQAA